MALINYLLSAHTYKGFVLEDTRSRTTSFSDIWAPLFFRFFFLKNSLAYIPHYIWMNSFNFYGASQHYNF